MPAHAFACDAMLGTLARWLRFAGFDTVYEPGLGDEQLAARCRSEERWLLTRDRELASRAGPRVMLLRETALDAQVAELRRRLDLAAVKPFSRCPCCNGELRESRREEIEALVPPYVAAHAQSFRRCQACGKVYWPGTHTPRIASRLERLLRAQ